VYSISPNVDMALSQSRRGYGRPDSIATPLAIVIANPQPVAGAR